MKKEILRLKKEKEAIILAHNYQRKEVQDIADFVGDSIELCQKASETKSKIIVFCGVDFMAQSAVILNPEKKVLIPSQGALCPMAQMLPPDYLKLWLKKYPDASSVLYVNTMAESKALVDICCTSANAVQIIERIKNEKILFGPDNHLANYVAKKLRKKIIPLPPGGYCPVHVLFEVRDLLKLKRQHPKAILIVHPECKMDVIQIADFVGSTSQMCHFVKKSKARTFIVGTEVGIIYRLKKENPQKKFIPANSDAICQAMKAINLEKVYFSLKEEKYEVNLPEETIKKAQKSLERMFEICKGLNKTRH